MGRRGKVIYIGEGKTEKNFLSAFQRENRLPSGQFNESNLCSSRLEESESVFSIYCNYRIIIIDYDIMLSNGDMFDYLLSNINLFSKVTRHVYILLQENLEKEIIKTSGKSQSLFLSCNHFSCMSDFKSRIAHGISFGNIQTWIGKDNICNIWHVDYYGHLFQERIEGLEIKNVKVVTIQGIKIL